MKRLTKFFVIFFLLISILNIYFDLTDLYLSGKKIDWFGFDYVILLFLVLLSFFYKENSNNENIKKYLKYLRIFLVLYVLFFIWFILSGIFTPMVSPPLPVPTTLP